jgi:hypothetical protein
VRKVSDGGQCGQILIGKQAIFNPSEQSGEFNRENGCWASEPKARVATG